MLAALVFSVLFLASYIVYHHFMRYPFSGQGPIRLLYFFILISHIVLSIVALPLSSPRSTMQPANSLSPTKRSPANLPVWLYVSVTGVLVFFFLRAYT